ncbi:hypothetical protein [Dyella mobilis]|uniref:Uncharacterized protein n=1 Tax=Dyella mobilis TaxID=1849582 RepID=A0ABS2KJY6_9GAMM|nr:hypothetical protein [Dyella mobilis]MBM7131384.1 hypothetical protein [Dyella mobilis]GLQ98679.1 hypothetical protein GCM10007863_30990 [Dyella mobilis]
MRTSKTFRTKAEAEAWGASKGRDVHRRQQRDCRTAEKLLFRNLLERYEREKASTLKSAEVLHNHLARLHEDFGHLRFAALTPETLTAWRDERLRAVRPPRYAASCRRWAVSSRGHGRIS